MLSWPWALLIERSNDFKYVIIIELSELRTSDLGNELSFVTGAHFEAKN